jgi:N-acetylglucosamine-6-sulfatase
MRREVVQEGTEGKAAAAPQEGAANSQVARVRAALALAVAAAFLAGAVLVTGSAAAQPDGRANVVVIQTDDQALAWLYARQAPPGKVALQAMPNTLGLIGGEGITFRRHYVSDPLCCPSRATLLTGAYAHNHRVLGNGPLGGGYMAMDKRNNLAVWLQDAGYRTIHVGKYLNYYGEPPFSDPLEVPPGWSQWETLVGEESTHYFYGYRLNVNGELTGRYGDLAYSRKDPPGCPESPPQPDGCQYQTDELTRRAVAQIAESAPGGPFFLSLDYVAPHGDYPLPDGPEPATRHDGSWAAVPVPRPPGFNERDVSDKPRWIRRAPKIGRYLLGRTQTEWQNQIESLRAVDDGVREVIEALHASGELGQTYLFFTSDNGFFSGQHRIHREKFLPYEPSVRVPLLVRGPGIPRGVRSAELTANLDLTPTILEVAGATPSVPVDGRSVLPFARDPAKRSRRPLLLEAFTKAVEQATARAETSIWAPIRDYQAIRFGPYKYVRYAGGVKELYDLPDDPYELHSRQKDPRYRLVRRFLAKRLRWLRLCSGKSCRRGLRARIPQPLPR